MSQTQETFSDELKLSRIEEEIHRFSHQINRIERKINKIMSTQAEFDEKVAAVQESLDAIAATIAGAVPPATVDVSALDGVNTKLTEISTELTSLLGPPVVPPGPAVG